MKREESWLYLEDGTEIKGLSFGSHTEKQGDVVFTTVMNGYPESFTDPSYKGQMLVMSHPLVGNYGVPRESYKDGILENLESEHVTIEGLIVTEVTDGGKWNKGRSLDDWLKENDVPGIAGIDTRFLIKKIRENGVLRGIISNDRLDAEDRFEEVYEKTNSASFGPGLASGWNCVVITFFVLSPSMTPSSGLLNHISTSLGTSSEYDAYP